MLLRHGRGAQLPPAGRQSSPCRTAAESTAPKKQNSSTRKLSVALSAVHARLVWFGLAGGCACVVRPDSADEGTGACLLIALICNRAQGSRSEAFWEEALKMVVQFDSQLNYPSVRSLIQAADSSVSWSHKHCSLPAVLGVALLA